jgi:hypothetical protein
MERGISDEMVLLRTNEHEAVLLTVNKDFGELSYRQETNTLRRHTDSATGLSNQTKAQFVPKPGVSEDLNSLMHLP